MEIPPQSRKLWRLFVFCCLLCVSAFCNASLEAGVDWLSEQQQPSGSYYTTDTSATSFQSTVEALRALTLLSSVAPSNSVPAMDYLNNQPLSHLEYLVLRLEIGELLGDEELAPLWSSVQQYRHVNGGYGDYIGYERSVAVTAMVLRAMAGSESQEHIQQAIEFLLSMQHSDGGWGEPGNESSVYVTAWVSSALQKHRFRHNVSNQIAAATQYLLSHQSSSGIQLSGLDTAMALLAIMPVTVDPARYQYLLGHLRAIQHTNGSWENDVHTTALALQVLHSSQSIPVPPDPDSGRVSGRLLNGVTGEPLVGVEAGILGTLDVSVSTDGAGRVLLTALSPGNHVLRFQSGGLLSEDLYLDLGAGQHVDFGQIALFPAAGAGVISGRVTDAVSGNPLAEALVVLSGSTNAQVTTDASGFYQAEVEPGDISIDVSLPGYDEASASVAMSAGSYLNFSPALLEQGETTPANTVLRGRVHNADTGLPLQGVSIRAGDLPQMISTGPQGEFLINDIDVGRISLEAVLPGYQSLSISSAISSGGVVDLGTLYLVPVRESQSGIWGIVTDASNGDIVSGAVINAAGVSAISDEGGRYQLEGIELLEFSLSANATGYFSDNFEISMESHGLLQVDVSLTKVRSDNINIDWFAAAQTSYESYSEVELVAGISNAGERTESVVSQVQVFGPDGQMIEEYMVSTSEDGGVSAVSLPPGDQQEVSILWFTQAHGPGSYRFILGIYSEDVGLLLDQREMAIFVVPAAQVSVLRVYPSINHVDHGASESFDILAFVRNRSNVHAVVEATYELLNPGGISVYEGSFSISLSPGERSAVSLLDSIEHTFTESGSYVISVAVENHVTVGLVEGGEIAVIPDVRIDLLQGLTPESASPGADERVRVRIRIEGMEANQ